MSKLFKFSLLVVSLLLLVNVSLAQKAKPKATPKVAKQTKVDLGVLRQNTYTNDFFAIKIEFPFGWLVGDNTLEAELIKLQTQNVQATNPKDQKAVNQAMDRLTPLLGGYKALPGSVAENSSLKIVVENLATAPTIKTSEAYLKLVLASLGVVKLPAGLTVSEIKSEVINGKTLQYVETKYMTAQKRNYVMIRKGFAVLITIDSYNQEEFDALHKVLTEADLDYKKTN